MFEKIAVDSDCLLEAVEFWRKVGSEVLRKSCAMPEWEFRSSFLNSDGKPMLNDGGSQICVLQLVNLEERKNFQLNQFQLNANEDESAAAFVKEFGGEKGGRDTMTNLSVICALRSERFIPKITELLEFFVLQAANKERLNQIIERLDLALE